MLCVGVCYMWKSTHFSIVYQYMCTCAYVLVYVVTCRNPHPSVFCISTCVHVRMCWCTLLHVEIHTLQYFLSVHVYMCVYVGVCCTSCVLVRVLHTLTCYNTCIVLALTSTYMYMYIHVHTHMCNFSLHT